MLHQQPPGAFGDTQKMLARAMHEAGSTDREIADAIPTSVNNIIWWRKGEGLRENVAGQTEAYTPPVRRESAAPKRSRPDRPEDFGMEPQFAAARPQPKAPAPDLLSPEQARVAYAAPVKPDGDNALELGAYMAAPVYADLGELLTTRLLIQGNSGSGKTHLLRRLLEECTGIVQQIIIDPEGDFVGFGETFGHTVIDARKQPPARLATIAGRVRHLRGSVVLNMDDMEIEQQMDAVSAFLGGLFDAPAEDWHPAIVAVDEAHLFAPAGDNGEDRETRKSSQQAMANLMCRGRKRGLAGIIATQRLSKLHKNVAAEASNYLIGRTFLDIDIARAADLLGMARAQAEEVRNLVRGEFLGLGPAISRRTLKVTVGPCLTQGKAGVEKGITPLPSLKPEDMENLLMADDEAEPEPQPVAPPAPSTVVPFASRAK